MKSKLIPLIVFCALVMIALYGKAPKVHGQSPVLQATQGQSNTQQTTFGVGVLTKTITGLAGTRAQVYGVAAYCAVGTSNLTITDGGTTIWSTQNGAVTATTQFAHDWPTPLAAVSGNTMLIQLASCSGNNGGTLIVQSSQY